jgi:hypothetical protein
MIFQNWFRGDLSCFIKFRGSKIHFHRLGADVLQPSYVGGEVYFFLECMNVQPESLSLEHMLVDDIREVFSLWLSRWNLFLATRAHSLLIKFEFRKSLAGQKPKSRFLPRYHTNIGPNRPPLLSLSLSRLKPTTCTLSAHPRHSLLFLLGEMWYVPWGKSKPIWKGDIRNSGPELVRCIHLEYWVQWNR